MVACVRTILHTDAFKNPGYLTKQGLCRTNVFTLFIVSDVATVTETRVSIAIYMVRFTIILSNNN